MTKIIVPIDFSSTSTYALQYGCHLSNLTGYNLEAVHVHDGYDGEEGLVIKKGSARIRSRVKERLEEFVVLHANTMTFAGTHDDNEDLSFIKCREVIGTAIGQLVRLSKQEDIAMILMGGVGSGIPSPVTPLFGSIAKEVATQAECSVLLIPENKGVPKIEQVALAFDEVKTLVGLSEKTEFLRKALSPDMHFTHVKYRDSLVEEIIEEDLRNEILRNNFPDYTVDFDLLPEGDVTNVLIDYSMEHKIDLLVLGRHPKGFLMNLLSKSDIPRILGLCAIPMLIVPLSE